MIHRIIILALAVTLLLPGTLAAKLIFCCKAENDLFSLMKDARRLDSPNEALNAAEPGDGVLILADGYPDHRTSVPPQIVDLAGKKNLHVYVEYPEQFPGLHLGKVRKPSWERVVVGDDFFGEALPKLRIVTAHDTPFIEIEGGPGLLSMARVAGYDTAVYGLPPSSHPLLLSCADDRILVAATKLSNFITARYAPAADWKTIWQKILKHLDAKSSPPGIDFVPIVRPTFSADEKVPSDLERTTFDRAWRWYLRSRLILNPQRRDEIHKALAAGVEEIDTPPDESCGDGTLGIIEGYSSAIAPDGNQRQRAPLRADCIAETAMVLALSGDAPACAIASNLLDYTFGPEMQSMGRLDPNHPAYGLITWGAVSPAWQIANYGDDNARTILAALAASAAMRTERWNEAILRAICANLRTTGSLGFRGDRIDVPALETRGWRHFHDAKTINFCPHFESYLWACNLWAYARTGDKSFLANTANAIGMTMEAYAKQQWRWMDNIERSRMLLCLAWLVRIEDTSEHRAWLNTITTDLLSDQLPCGAIRERRGTTEGGHSHVPQSNDAYGTSETPLIQRNGDPASDQLYTTAFALLALHEAARATGDAKLKSAEDKLAEFLCRIQIKSERIAYLDGAWFRAFDDRRWDYWASSADVGWGAWCVEAGWGQAWIAATLSLRQRKTTLWDFLPARIETDQLNQLDR